MMLLLALWLVAAPPPPAAGDADRVRLAKELYFDRKYAAAHEAWQAVLARAQGAEGDAAAYWIARSSESLGDHERAFREYGEFLARRPADLMLAEEARTSRVGLAVRLYKKGQAQHLGVAVEALKDPSKTVRYYAALQLAGLGRETGRPAVPILCRIVHEERDEDLVERAKLALLRLDPECLGRAETPRGEGRFLKVRIFEGSGSQPSVSINLPMALAELAFKSLPDDARRELRKKGYDADNFWEQLRKLPPSQIIDIRGEDGERIQIWIE